ncbi:uncharacterized protein LOC122536149 [Frieseomelitta varia]|uniref:uncharacterized protein LOC122536149 n=1 Tax=Frieseomelitta varia TaxID=561572 RepID=UPI001CB6854F|nr:uncharacterized protein LOC122536149 [Frieseomelitta varia]
MILQDIANDRINIIGSTETKLAIYRQITLNYTGLTSQIIFKSEHNQMFHTFFVKRRIFAETFVNKVKAAIAFVLALLGILFVAEYSCAAAIKSEEFVQLEKKLSSMCNFDSQRIRRATESVEDRPKRNCYDTTPCGWNMYTTL